MLIFSKAKITVRGIGNVMVEGKLKRYHIRIKHFLTTLRLPQGTIHYRFGRYVFSRNIEEGTQQKIRNFLFNECPLKK